MAKYEMCGSQPVLVSEEPAQWVQPGAGGFEAQISPEREAWLVSIGAVRRLPAKKAKEE